MTEEREAGARIKINKLLEASGWRFEDGPEGTANIELEAGVKFSELGDDLENAVSRSGARGAIDFLLLDKDKRPLVVIEAKRSRLILYPQKSKLETMQEMLELDS